jgi:protein involved in temperature-dependent protein secretion
MSFEAIEEDKKELEEMCEEAEEKIAEAMSSKTTAWMHKAAADEYIEKIRKIIEEYEAANGDEAAKSAADECERLRDELVEDGKTIADILAALKLKVEAILQHVKDAAEEMDKAKAARDMALDKLEEAKGKVNLSTGEGEGETDDQTLAELE